MSRFPQLKGFLARDIATFEKVYWGMNDLEKAQKTTAQDLSNFKISTQNSFETINDVVESRDGASKPQSLAEA